MAAGEAAAAAASGETPHRHLDRLAAALPADGAVLFLPYMLGEKTPLNDPHARGVLFGLTHEHGPADIAHAVLRSLLPDLRQARNLSGNGVFSTQARS
jgi:xylulokinase